MRHCHRLAGQVEVRERFSVTLPAHGVRALAAGTINGKPWELSGPGE